MIRTKSSTHVLFSITGANIDTDIQKELFVKRKCNNMNRMKTKVLTSFFYCFHFQIDLDVNRTYRDHIMFRERYNPRQNALFHVLAAYSVYNTELGYCQGMSQIAALLLMYLYDEEDAFWALHRLMVHPKHAMHGFFIQGFPKLLRFQSHHDKVMRKFLPKLKKHLDRQGIDTGIYTLKWFFQCFLDRVR